MRGPWRPDRLTHAAPQSLVFEQLNAIIRASSLVDMVHACIRPSRKSCTGHMTKETLKLIMVSQNPPTPDVGTEPATALAGQAILNITASESLRQQPVADAASIATSLLATRRQ